MPTGAGKAGAGSHDAARPRRRRVQVVRTGQRPQQRDRVDSAGHHRPARSQWCGQVDVHEVDDGPAQAEPGRHPRAGRADLGQPGGVRPHRLLSGTGCVLRPHDRAGVGDRAGPVERIQRRGRRRGRQAGPGQGGSAGRRGQEDRRLQQGHAPARQARAGARARSGIADPRRAADRHGSDHAPQDHPADQGLEPAPASTSSSRATSCTRSSR